MSKQVLDEVHAFLGRFIAYPSPDAQIAHTLWICHCHLMDVWENTPRLAFLSPEPGSGKSRALEITELLVPNPVLSVNATPAYLFRRVNDPNGLPTILYDEIDTIFGDKAKENEELRGLINAGHRRGATAGRCVTRGNTIETEDFPAYCAVAMAGLGRLPDTILSRSVVIRMRKRKHGETVEPYRRRQHATQGAELRERVAARARTVREALDGLNPEMPPGVEDRDADVWEALLAVADLAGGEWPAKARVAAVRLVNLARRDGGASLGARLLADLQIIFGDEKQLHTSAILMKLQELDESPWGSIRGEPIGDRLLANLLKAYDIYSESVRIGNISRRGYCKRDLMDAWERYLPPLPSPERASQGSHVSQVAYFPLLLDASQGPHPSQAPHEQQSQTRETSPLALDKGDFQFDFSIPEPEWVADQGEQ